MMKGKCQWHNEDCDRTIECMECERFPDNEDKPNFMAEPKKVTVYEYGCPMCPACGEPPYDDERCYFCGQRYIDERKPERPTLRGAHYLDGTDEAVCDKCSAPQSLWRFVAHGDGPKVYRNTYNCQCGQCITATHQRNGGAVW
jgi:hypothetical protein